MGCETSRTSERVSGKESDNNRTNDSQGFASRFATYEDITKAFTLIVGDARTIVAPSDMMCVVCQLENAFPIVTSQLHLEDSTPTEIQMPIIAGSICGKGKVICFSQVSFLSSRYLSQGDTKKFMKSALGWIAGETVMMNPLIAMGFSKDMTKSLTSNISDLGFYPEFTRFHTGVAANRQSIIITSSLKLDQAKIDFLYDFVHNKGGGLAVFYVYDQCNGGSEPINELLSKFGLAYTFCVLNENIDVSNFLQIPTNLEFIIENNFIRVSKKFLKTLQSDNIDKNELDDLVTTLRYYVMPSDENNRELVIRIYESIWDYLKTHNYSTRDGICPHPIHAILMVLLTDIYTKLPISMITPIPESDVFPGKTGNVEFNDYTMEIELHNEEWITTGLWLPAGKRGIIECEERVDSLHIQIGSHHESLLIKDGPFKRWPQVASIVPITEESTDIASVFGGIIYIGVNDKVLEIESKKIPVTFKNFCKYPFYDDAHPEIWEETKNIDVPWSELKIGSIIFTLPTEKILKIANFETMSKTFSVIEKGIAEYLEYDERKPYRVVFDIELADDRPSCGYPLVFEISEVDRCLIGCNKASSSLFTMVVLLATISLPEGCFNQLTETAIAAVVATIIFQKLFPGFDPHGISDIELPLLFNEFWEIHTSFDENLIPKVIEALKHPDYSSSEIPDDQFNQFFKVLCSIAQTNFMDLFKPVQPIPLNLITSLKQYPTYQPKTNCL